MSAKINENFLKLKSGYLFPEIAKRTKTFSQENSSIKIIRLGIGDVTLPLTPSVLGSFHAGVDEMGEKETFRGYGPEQGYPFLIKKILEKNYLPLGVHLEEDEIFVSDGSKCDTGNIQEIFGISNRIAVTDPVYPVYVDTNVMAGRSGEINDKGRYQGIHYISCLEENNFKPIPPSKELDIIYLCSPNNPTGIVMTKEDLKDWVSYAKKHNAIILFDAAYEAFIQDDDIPHSIYEIEGAKEVAIEFRSFSKNAGFTGTRCAFTVVPKQLYAQTEQGEKIQVNPIWNRRHCTKFNGVSFPVQRAAAAVYTDEGKREVKELIFYYMDNAKVILQGLQGLGLKTFGGKNAPYIWMKTPGGMKSWDFFDHLLKRTGVVGTPGSGFGPAGEGYFRLSAFGDKEEIKEAMERIKSKLF